MKKIFHFVLPVLFLVLIIFLWQCVGVIFNVNPIILPLPSKILFAFTQNIPLLVVHTWQTVLETIIGLCIAIILGFATAIILDMSEIVRKTLYPMLISSQTIPIVALAPLLLLWFGFDLLPKVIIVVLYCYFPITIATVNGFAGTDKKYKTLLESMDANYFQSLSLVKIPYSMPQFFSGLKIAATYAMSGAMVGEYVGAEKGLGIFLQTSANAHQIALVFAIVFLTAIISLLLFGIVSVAEKIIVPWKNQ